MKLIIHLLVLLISYTLMGQASEPIIWVKTTTTASGSYLSNFDSIICPIEAYTRQEINTHPLPVLNANTPATSFAIDEVSGLTVFSVYQNIHGTPQKLWSCGDTESASHSAGTDLFCNHADGIQFYSTGLSDIWLRVNTHFVGISHSMIKPQLFHLGDIERKSMFSGLMPEILVFDKVLSKRECKKVESYLALKYGVPLLSSGLLSYQNSLGQTIWSAKGNHLFRHRIAGLARDDYWGLQQLQGTSAYEPNLLSIKLGATWDKIPREQEISDLSYLIWADNNGALSTPHSVQALGRQWEMTVSDSFQSPTALKLGHRQLKEELEDGDTYWLAIDNSGTSNFPLENTEYFKPNDRTSEFMFYNNISWKQEREQKAIFSFRKGNEDMLLLAEANLPECGVSDTGGIKFKVVGGTPPYNYRVNNSRKLGFSGELTHLRELKIGKYKLVVTDANGISVERDVELYFAGLIPTNLFSDRYEIKENGTFELTIAAACNSCKYTWYLSDGTMQSGTALNSRITGDYILEVSNGDCTYQHIFSVEHEGNRSNFQSLEIWGNPSSEGKEPIVEIRLWENHPVQLNIWNSEGQLVRKRLLPANHYYKIPQAGLKPGTYMVQIVCEGEIRTKRLLVI